MPLPDRHGASLRPSTGSSISISKRDEGRMAPIAGRVPQNIATPAGSLLVAVAPACDQLARGADPGQRAFLVEHLLAAFLDEAAQHRAGPNAARRPRSARPCGRSPWGRPAWRRDAVALELAIGMVGADRDPEPVRRAHQHGLDFARRVVAQHLDAVGLGQQARRRRDSTAAPSTAAARRSPSAPRYDGRAPRRRGRSSRRSPD